MVGARRALEVARLKALRPEEAAKDCLRHRDLRSEPGLRGRSAQPGHRNRVGRSADSRRPLIRRSGPEGSVEGQKRHDGPRHNGRVGRGDS